jgi:hypothetical protein
MTPDSGNGRVALVPFAVLTWAKVRRWRSALGVGGWERSSIALIALIEPR